MPCTQYYYTVFDILFTTQHELLLSLQTILRLSQLKKKQSLNNMAQNAWKKLKEWSMQVMKCYLWGEKKGLDKINTCKEKQFPQSKHFKAFHMDFFALRTLH